MANQTLTDVTRNYDDAAISGLLNGEDITLNNSTLIINSDVRWGQQAAVLGNLAISATLGGLARIDGRDVWWMPYDNGTGNVPALGTVDVNDVTGSIAGAGEFLGVFTALGVAPTAAGNPMPATGFIKFRRVTAAFVDNETMSFAGGATADVNSATGGQRGWIHFVGEEGSTATVPRLGRFETIGDWFELGTTSGADDQTFQYPVTDCCPAIQIETSAGSGVYEWYLNAGARWATATQFVPTDVRGKYFGMVNATGVITIAQRASNACGYKPPAGCKVRIPNILVSNSTSASGFTANTINATLATRWDFTTTSAGDIDIRNTCGNWYIAFSNAFNVVYKHSCILHSMSLNNIANITEFENIAVGLNDVNQFAPITVSNNLGDSTFTSVRAARYASTASGNFAFQFVDTNNVTLTNCQGEVFGSLTAVTRGNATCYAVQLNRCENFFISNFSALGGRVDVSTSRKVTVSNTKYADQINGTTVSTNPQSAIVTQLNASDLLFDGFSPFGGLSDVHPYSGIFNLGNSSLVTIRNIGTPSSPYSGGSVPATQCGLIANIITSIDVVFRRVYVENLRTAAITVNTQSYGLICENVWGDGGDSQTFSSSEVLAKGCRWTNSITAVGSQYGRHWQDAFTSTTAGRIVAYAQEPLTSTLDQIQITAGTPAFTAAGTVAMRNVGDEVTWTCPYYILGYTALANIAPTITAVNSGNFNFEYQIDTGTGFSAWKTLNGTNLSSETISPTTGFKLKIRATTTVANSGNSITMIRIDGVTDAVNQQVQYPLPFDAAIEITGIVAGSRIQVYNVTTATEIINEIVPTSVFMYEYYNGVDFSDGDTVRVRLSYNNGATARLPQQLILVAGETGFQALAAQEQDTVYNDNAIDGTTVTELSGDFPNIQIDSNDVDGETTVQRMYAWFSAETTTEDGIRTFFGGLRAEDAVNYRVESSLVNLQIDNIIATPLKIVGGRIYRSDGETVIAPTSNSIQIDPDKAYVAAGGGGGGSGDWTSTEKSQIRFRLGIDGITTTPLANPNLARASDVPSASANASAVRTELTTELGRIDANITSRLATAAYTAPANADITAIKAKTDNLPTEPADNVELKKKLNLSDFIGLG